MSSSSTRRVDRTFAGIAASRDEVQRSGRLATTPAVAEGSFFVAPVDVAPLVSFPDGIAPALQTHLAGQGLSALAATVPGLAKLSARLRRTGRTDQSVSETVYQMH